MRLSSVVNTRWRSQVLAFVAKPVLRIRRAWERSPLSRISFEARWTSSLRDGGGGAAGVGSVLTTLVVGSPGRSVFGPGSGGFNLVSVGAVSARFFVVSAGAIPGLGSLACW